MIKWKKQCEFCNKNLRMKTKIEAITNKRTEKKNVEKCTKTKEKILNKEIKCIFSKRRLNGALRVVRNSFSDKRNPFHLAALEYVIKHRVSTIFGLAETKLKY